jgi:cation transport ATPase
MNLNFHLKMAGALMIALALAHLYFEKRFGWRQELERVSLLTRQIFYVHCFFICLLLVLLGMLSLFGTATLLQRTPLAKMVLAGLVVFWAARLGAQFFVYDARLWRGNAVNTAAHIVFSLMWAYYLAVYGMALGRQFGS